MGNTPTSATPIAQTLQNPPFRCSGTCGNTLPGRKGLSKHGPGGAGVPARPGESWGKQEQGTAPGRHSVLSPSPSKGTRSTQVKQARTFPPAQLLVPPTWGLSGWAGGPGINGPARPELRISLGLDKHRGSTARAGSHRPCCTNQPCPPHGSGHGGHWILHRNASAVTSSSGGCVQCRSGMRGCLSSLGSRKQATVFVVEFI